MAKTVVDTRARFGLDFEGDLDVEAASRYVVPFPISLCTSHARNNDPHAMAGWLIPRPEHMYLS